MSTLFNPDCKLCKRLSHFLSEVKSRHPDYYCKPVPPFGDPDARLLIVGLAPGMHGANRTGRPFTGDHAGILLYETLYKTGFSNQPQSRHNNDTLKLTQCRISNAVKCLPPQNKPNIEEIKTCNDFLRQEIKSLPTDSIIVALGKIAHDATLRALHTKLSAYPFSHAATHHLQPGKTLIDSYHCSRYNTQTRRLTTQMFEDIFLYAKSLL